MLLYRRDGAPKRNTRFSLNPSLSVLFPQSCASRFPCLSQATCYRESLRRVQSRWDCPRVTNDLSCPHGMFPQRAYLSSRSWPNNAGSCFSPSSAGWTPLMSVVESVVPCPGRFKSFHYLFPGDVKVKVNSLNDLYLEQLQRLV
jgi:hypothetical protein